jgi:hypothetical protein
LQPGLRRRQLWVLLQLTAGAHRSCCFRIRIVSPPSPLSVCGCVSCAPYKYHVVSICFALYPTGSKCNHTIATYRNTSHTNDVAPKHATFHAMDLLPIHRNSLRLKSMQSMQSINRSIDQSNAEGNVSGSSVMCNALNSSSPTSLLSASSSPSSSSSSASDPACAAGHHGSRRSVLNRVASY